MKTEYTSRPDAMHAAVQATYAHEAPYVAVHTGDGYAVVHADSTGPLIVETGSDDEFARLVGAHSDVGAC
jgi:hypothetical protein